MIDPCAIEPKSLLTVEQALEQLTGTINPISDDESIGLAEAQGRILSRPLFSPINLPYDTNAAMDGYAFDSQCIDRTRPFCLRLVGTSWAGRPFQGVLDVGDCIRIYTGAVLPDSADSVVMQEHVKATGRQIHFPAGIEAGKNVRQAGEDVARNSLLFSAGRKLTSVDIALLAAAGIAEVPVIRRVEIAYLATGDELMDLGEAPVTGKIYDSNRYILACLLKDPCFQLTDLGKVGDDLTVIESLLMAAGDRFDAILSTGGASVGEADYIKTILESFGRVHFWKIAIKPGKPLAFGTFKNSYFFGLPGNPLSVLVTFQQIVTPALRRLSGALPAKRLQIKATCRSAIQKNAGRQEYVCGLLSQESNGEFFVVTNGVQGSHKLGMLSGSQCFIVLPLQSRGVEPGDTVMVEPFELLW